ncbi:hypothetical protein Cflav_PD2682 [Pedosphaera parvula Ellin514]|uniref:Uncharacterized protein n=1 Tax=Pedosphaera parvula (strain Ellin514) TaxID=320771 RepID=B9XKM3_PEDPL|nr:hypothetical protein Cflav_PD2682 [Pedosphaera parvula Ellin514]
MPEEMITVDGFEGNGKKGGKTVGNGYVNKKVVLPPPH